MPREIYSTEREEGIKLYVQLLTDVQRAQVDEAVNEFERRFLPMLDPAFENKD